jgi:predicted GNAT superfamily acetyltransferase
MKNGFQLAVSIRILTKVEEFFQCESLQTEVWGTGELSVVPITHLLTASKNGGMVLGAFTPNGKMIGFCYSFPGLVNGEIIMSSHMIGLLKEYRSSGVGYRLKLAQRVYSLERGIKRINWTFDPLESANAVLNIRKLGGIVRTYYENLYGNSPDLLNQNLPSDRLFVEWYIDSTRVVERIKVGDQLGNELSPEGLVALLIVQETTFGIPEITDTRLGLREERLFLEIPRNFYVLKKTDPDLAWSWRNEVRRALSHYFIRGYLVTDFGDLCDRQGYVLEQKATDQL